jgi:ArsR family transcriptional regulator, arsenate/arsenite/antimonite-responsive transcriptional repressor / arsenate reductase (thioredoxin)
VSRATVHRLLGEPNRLAIIDALRASDRTPGELRSVTGLRWNLLAFHLRRLEDAGLIERRVSEGDRRKRYVRLLPAALAPLRPPAEPPADGVLFVCTRNAARSQFAAGLWSARTAHGAASAGADPAPEVHPLAVAEAARYGVDLSCATPRGYDAVHTEPALVVSVCDRATEQGVPFAAARVHWSVPDPVGGGRAAFQAAFADIAARVEQFADRIPA